MLSCSDIHLTSYVSTIQRKNCHLPLKCSNKNCFQNFRKSFQFSLIQNITAIKPHFSKSSNNHKMVSFPQSVVPSRRRVVVPQEEWGPEQQMCPGPGQPHLTDVPVSKQMILLRGSSIDQSQIQKQDVRGKKS